MLEKVLRNLDPECAKFIVARFSPPNSRPHNPRQRFLVHIHPCQPRSQRFGDARLAPMSSGQLPADGPGCIGVIAQVDRFQHGLLKRIGIVESPDRRFQTLDDPSRTLDGRWFSPSNTRTYDRVVNSGRRMKTETLRSRLREPFIRSAVDRAPGRSGFGESRFARGD